MTRYLLSILFALSLATFTTIEASAEPIMNIDQEQNVSITTIGNATLRVTGANGETLHIYNVAGVRVLSIKVEGHDKQYQLNLPKGCYIVKVGNTVRKIAIKM